jgi:RNA polymerase sigma factor (sigma-70 family)
MRATPRGLALKDLGRLFRDGALPAGDAALLECFLAQGDETAFEAIVARHGSMVLGVCRRLLGDSHDADDAFQATFLVLVRKARQLRDAERLGPWLYGVATRVATKARAREARRRAWVREMPLERDVACGGGANGESDWIDVRPILDAELGKLSPKLRDILVLCLLEGLTAEEASHRLACPVGTVKSRLARGREALRGRLTARGLGPAVALAVVSGAARTALASQVPEALSLTTVGMAGLALEQIPPAVVALTNGVAINMLHKSSALAAVVCGGLVLTGTGMVAWQKSHASAAQPGAREARGPTDQAKAETVNNLKAIMLAFHNYQMVNGHLPAKAIFGTDGKPKLSWRVALLPFLEKEALYHEFHLNEPWDSPHNKALIARMPDVFRTPSSPTADGRSRIRGFEGPRTIFKGKEGIDWPQITDGTSNTLAIVLAEQAVPWTRPGDLPVEEGDSPPPVDDSDESGVFVGMVDGSVHRVPPADGAFWRKLITADGGEVIQWPQDIHPLPPQPVRAAVRVPGGPTPAILLPTRAAVAAGPAPGISPELEARLRAIEEKLDRVLRKLESAEEGRKPR